MRMIRRCLAACAFLGGIGAAVTLWAAESNLPETNFGIAPAQVKQAQDALKRDAICTRCHDESEPVPILSIYQTRHGVRGDARTPTCQSCHGDSEKHLKGDPNVKGRAPTDVVFKKGVYAVSSEEQRAGQCLSCHKGARRTNWHGGQHEINGVACNNCHTVHRPNDPVLSKKTQTGVCFACHKEQRADSYKVSTHPMNVGTDNVAKVVCSDCHNPHGSAGPTLLRKNTVTETCYVCHAEKRGPFLFEHQPVVENCNNCHTPHGSNFPPLLKSRPAFLCQECHDGTHISQQPVGPNAGGFQAGLSRTNPVGAPQFPSRNVTGRACMNCHVLIHGSNSPAGGYFQR